MFDACMLPAAGCCCWCCWCWCWCCCWCCCCCVALIVASGDRGLWAVADIVDKLAAAAVLLGVIGTPPEICVWGMMTPGCTSTVCGRIWFLLFSMALDGWMLPFPSVPADCAAAICRGIEAVVRGFPSGNTVVSPRGNAVVVFVQTPVTTSSFINIRVPSLTSGALCGCGCSARVEGCCCGCVWPMSKVCDERLECARPCEPAMDPTTGWAIIGVPFALEKQVCNATLMFDGMSTAVVAMLAADSKLALSLSAEMSLQQSPSTVRTDDASWEVD